MSKTPIWFKVTASIALLWNLLGCFAFASDLSLKPEDIAKLSEAEQALYKARPMWTLAATGTAVLGGATGCLGLLLGKKWAFPALVLSLIAVLVQDFALFNSIEGASLAGPVVIGLQTFVLLVAIGLVFLARYGARKHWLT